MPLKIKNLKFIIKSYVLAFCFLTSFSSFSQEIIEDEKVETPQPTVVDSVQRIKLDGVNAVIGDFVILNSDIDKQFTQLEAGGISIEDISRCQLFGKLLEDKLYMHHAIQDSLEVSDVEIKSYVDQQLQGFAEQIGSMEKLVAYYKKSSEKQLRDDMFELNKNNKLAALMQQKIVEEIEVTPEEVRQFFNTIPEDQRPLFGTEMRVAQIVVIPKTTKVEVDKVINRLKEFRAVLGVVLV